MEVNPKSWHFRQLPFWDRVRLQTKTTESGCSEFTGCKDECGYGRIFNGKKLVRLHRATWELHNGAVPDGMVVCHKCDNPSCINPEHLFVGSQLENIRDMDAKGRRAVISGSRHHKAKLDEKKVDEIREMVSDGFTCASLGRLFGVSEGTIRHIKSGRSWAS